MHRLLERICAVFRARLRQVASAHELKLVQLEALVYLASANRYSDTPMALAEYLELTKGTVSQTLKALEGRGLVTKTQDPEDRRVQHCAVTAEGSAIVEAALRIPSAGDAELERSLHSALRALQRDGGGRTFGVCETCVHHRVEGMRTRCGLTGEPLRKQERIQICREHEPAREA